MNYIFYTSNTLMQPAKIKALHTVCVALLLMGLSDGNFCQWLMLNYLLGILSLHSSCRVQLPV